MTAAVTDVDALGERVIDVWESLTELPVGPAVPGCLVGQDALTAVVGISGGSAVDVVVSVDRGAAECLACAVFATEFPSASDVLDAVGEFANQIAGLVKSLLPGEAELALPVVTVGLLAVPAGSGPALSWDVPGGHVCLRIWLRGSEGGGRS